MKTTTPWLAIVAASITLSGCVTNDQGQVVMDPGVSAAISAAFAPTQEPVEEAYEPMPYDSSIAVVSDRDVVFVGGSTYIWVTGPDGRRHRQLYAHGDHRADVFHRRDELHHVMTRHDGRLPDHAIAPHMAGGPQQGHGPAPEGGAPRMAHAPGAQPMMNAHAAMAPAPHPAPQAAKPQPPKDKDKKKT